MSAFLVLSLNMAILILNGSITNHFDEAIAPLCGRRVISSFMDGYSSISLSVCFNCLYGILFRFSISINFCFWFESSPS
ncbi:003R [Invertebrate iridescent virus Kaz2018]|uniref:003R n=1 Tax=Invertebrate iridescent virus 6 TaxID=176652 RepID=Q91G91_IIV6|nr:003R [Invertebrate iridescent virus 6]AAK81940.1 003R [Invertebrate iridescent virus 6]QMS79337.1 hypothetical protein IIV6-T1_004 [Invertebrate iridescent virus 6]QNH08415.1 003R [Invertebrate iridescent virus Kaz2018]